MNENILIELLEKIEAEEVIEDSLSVSVKEHLNKLPGYCFDFQGKGWLGLWFENLNKISKVIPEFKMIPLTGAWGLCVLLSEEQLNNKTITIYTNKEFIGSIIGRNGQNLKYTIGTIKREYFDSKVEFIKVVEKDFKDYPKVYPFFM